MFESVFGLVNHKLPHLKTITVEVLCGLGVGSVLYGRKDRSTCLGRKNTWHFSLNTIFSSLNVRSNPRRNV